MSEETKPNLVSSEEFDTLKKQLEEGQTALQKLMAENEAKEAQIQKLTSDLTSTSSQLEEHANQLRNAQLEEAGVNSEQYSKIEQELEAKLTEKYSNEYGQRFAELENQNKQLQSQLHNVTTVSDTMSRYATDAEEATRDILEGIVGTQVHQDPNDASKTYVTDKFGNKKLSKKFPGQPMEAEEFMDELRSTRAPLFKSKKVTQQVMQNGQAMSANSATGNTNIIDGVDVERFKNDPDYYNSFDRATRVRIATKLGL